MPDVQLASGLWIPSSAIDYGEKSNRIAEVEYPHNLPDWSAVSRFKDFDSYLKALKIPWVFPCLSVIGYNFANTRFGIVPPRTEITKDTEIDPSDPLVKLLSKPNPVQDGFGFRELAEYYLELTGNVYIALEQRDGSMQPRELYAPNPARMRIKPGPDGVEGYVYDASPTGRTGSVGSGNLVYYAPDEIIHIKYPPIFDGWYGVGNVEASEMLLNIIAAMAQQEFSYWQSGGRIIGVLETDRRLSDADFLKLRREWRLANADAKQRVRTAILEQGLKYTPIAEGMRALNLTDIAKGQRDQTLAVFGVPLPKLGIMEQAQYKMTEADAFFWQETMHPKFGRWEAGIQPLVDLFDPSMVLRFERRFFEDDQYKITSAQQMVGATLATIDEGRAVVGLPPLPNGNGQVLLISSGYSPIHVGDVGTLADQTTAPPEPVPTTTQGGDDDAPDDDDASADASDDGIVHLTSHLPSKDIAQMIEYWTSVDIGRKHAAARQGCRPCEHTPIERAAKVYRK